MILSYTSTISSVIQIVTLIFNHINDIQQYTMQCEHLNAIQIVHLCKLFNKHS